MTKDEYIAKYGDCVISESTLQKLHQNLNKMYENSEWERKTSSYEKEIADFLDEHNIKYEEHNRTILNGLELDFLIGNKAIEFNGNKYHTEWFGGKDRNYHLNKTETCAKNGIGLIQIFEDELRMHRDLVFSKLSHIFGLDNNKLKIAARKTEIYQINNLTAEIFLNIYHIQGYSHSTIHYGCFFNKKLIAVMSFKKEKDNYWNLTRFASDYHYVCQGVGSKMFKTFLRENNPVEVKSFADRRWTINPDNIYIQKWDLF